MSLQDAFPARKEALASARDIRLSGVKGKVTVRKLRSAQDSGRLKYGVYHSGNYK